MAVFKTAASAHFIFRYYCYIYMLLPLHTPLISPMVHFNTLHQMYIIVDSAATSYDHIDVWHSVVSYVDPHSKNTRKYRPFWGATLVWQHTPRNFCFQRMSAHLV